MASLRVVIVGGSLGGLHTGLVLREIGCEVQIFEKSSAAMLSRGAGIVVQEETVQYLESQDICAREEISTAVHFRQYLTREGQVQRELPMHQRFTAWNTLYRAFKSAFPADRYHLAHRFTDFIKDNASITVIFENGREETCDLLVCADGVNSTARRLLLPEVHREYAGYVAWRGLVPEGEVPEELAGVFSDRFTFYQYPNSHVLCYLVPGPDGELQQGKRRFNWVWYVNVSQGNALQRVMTDRSGRRRKFSVPPGEVPETLVKELRHKAASDLPPLFADLIRRTKEPFIQPIIDVAVPQMAFERLCLLGDAAFVPRPHTAASTAKACANGFALAESLAGAAEGQVAQALSQWEDSQLELGRRLLQRGKALGDRSQFGR